MSTIVIAAFGTRGDVEPFTGLARQLTDDGHRVVIAGQEPYRTLVTAAGFEFRPLPGDTEQATRKSPAAQGFVDGARMRPSRHVLEEMRADMRNLGTGLVDTAHDADLLLLPAVAALLGYHVAEGLGIPSAGVFMQPTAPTGDFPPAVLGDRSFGRWGNRMLGRLGELGEKSYAPVINDLRESLGLTPTTRARYQRRRRTSWPILHGFSRHVVARPSDWPPHLHVTGYWWPEPTGWQPPQRLVDFLQCGPPPIFVGLGSTATAHGTQLSEIISKAVQSTGVRAVLQTGWAGLHCDGDDILTIGDAPHAWLFPRMSAIAHHCGAGTTAATLRFGVPSIAIPGIMDQPFWAKRLHRLGVAPPPIRRTALSVDKLAHAIDRATSDPSYRARAQLLSTAISEENGAATAAAIVTQLLEGVHHGK